MGTPKRRRKSWSGPLAPPSSDPCAFWTTLTFTTAGPYWRTMEAKSGSGRVAAPVAGGAEGAGESPLGDLVADATRAATGAELAAVNAGGLRADVAAGAVTFGHLFAVLPFGNALVTIRLTAGQLRALLEQQWLGQREPRRLHISGFEYAWDARRPPGERVVALTRGGRPLEAGATFSLALPSFLADGGDGFSVAAEAATRGRTTGPVDLDALLAHLAALPQPLRARVDGRIRRAP
jgi:5'-nucleotidase